MRSSIKIQNYPDKNHTKNFATKNTSSRKIDPNFRTLVEAKKCICEGIEIDTFLVSEEKELLKYALELENVPKGKIYHINQENMDQVLVNDYLTHTRKVLKSQHKW